MAGRDTGRSQASGLSEGEILVKLVEQGARCLRDVRHAVNICHAEMPIAGSSGDILQAYFQLCGESRDGRGELCDNFKKYKKFVARAESYRHLPEVRHLFDRIEKARTHLEDAVRAMSEKVGERGCELVKRGNMVVMLKRNADGAFKAFGIKVYDKDVPPEIAREHERVKTYRTRRGAKADVTYKETDADAEERAQEDSRSDELRRRAFRTALDQLAEKASKHSGGELGIRLISNPRIVSDEHKVSYREGEGYTGALTLMVKVDAWRRKGFRGSSGNSQRKGRRSSSKSRRKRDIRRKKRRDERELWG
jgi:hypothetical protein